MGEAYISKVNEWRGRVFSAEELEIQILDQIDVGGLHIDPAAPPAHFVHHKEIGIMAHETMRMRAIHAWPRPYGFAEPQRAVITPGGDYLLMAAIGKAHQWGLTDKANEIVAYRSKDKGATWSGPTLPWEVPYSQHAFNPLIPKGSRRIYTFGTDYHPDYIVLPHNGAIPIRYSDDDGYTWSEPRFISPVNDPEYRGVGHMQGCETDAGTWLLGTYFIEVKENGRRRDKQYILRSEDKGKTWTLLPDKRPNGWFLEEFDRMLEGQAINIGQGEVLFMIRTEEGHLWSSRSFDDGKTWSAPKPTTLHHPDSPPMVFHLADRKTLIAFIHNKQDLQLTYKDAMSRSELWFSLSRDKGETWDEPRFMMANTTQLDRQAREQLASGQMLGVGAVEICYGDLLVDGPDLHFFFDHRKRQVIQAHFKESDLGKFPTKRELEAWIG